MQHDSLAQPMPDAPSLDPATHWRLTRRLTMLLLASWFALTFGIIFFARELDALSLFGWPLSFYLAAQGATLAYVAIIGYYAWRMRSLDRRFKAQDDDAG